MRTPSGTTVVYVGYLVLLFGFVALGVFVAALAFGAPGAGWGGLAVSAIFAVAGATLRAGSRRLANTWAEPMARGEVDRYLRTYRP